MPLIAEVLATNLKALRERRNLSQAELAAKIGVDRQTIYNLEGGKRGTTLKTIAALAEVLGVEETDLVCPRPQEDHDIEECWRRVQREWGKR